MFYLCAYLLLALRKLLVVFTCSTNVTYLMKCLVTSSVIQLAGGRKRTKNTFQSSNSLESQCNSNRKKKSPTKNIFLAPLGSSTGHSKLVHDHHPKWPPSDRLPWARFQQIVQQMTHTAPVPTNKTPNWFMVGECERDRKKNVRFWNNSAGSRRKASHSKYQNRKLALKRLFFVFCVLLILHTFSLTLSFEEQIVLFFCYGLKFIWNIFSVSH